MRNSLIIMLLILGSSVLSAEPLWQQDVPVRESKDLRFNGCSVQDNGGSVFLGWIQTTNGEPCIMGQRFDAEGSEIWPQALVIKAESKEKSDPKVALSADGCYLLAWLEEYENGISKFFMQKLTMAGGLLWGYSGLVVMENLETGIADYLLLPNSEGGAYLIVKQDGSPRLYALKLDSSGNNLWPDGYPTITAQNTLSLSALLPDGEGGFFFFFKGYAQTGGTNYAERYAPTGYRYWRNSFPRLAGEDTSPHQVLITSDQKVIELAKSVDGNASLELRMFSFEGNQIFEPPLMHTISYSNSAAAEYQARLVNDSLLVIFSVGVSPTGSNAATIHPFSLTTGQFLPSIVISTNEAELSCPDIDLDMAGNLYCQWLETELSSGSTIVKAQKLSAGLQAVWPVTGVVMYSGSSMVSVPLAFTVGIGLLSFFQESAAKSVSLTKQIATSDGYTLFPGTGSCFASILMGSATLLASQALGTRICVFFYDNRDTNRNRLYYQIVDQDGSVHLETDGIPIGGFYPLARYISSIPLPGYGIALLYQDPQTYLQVIDLDGNLLLPGAGILITESRPSSMKLSALGSDIYLGWLENTVNGNPGSKRLMGQRVANWQLQWEGGGKQLVDNIPTLNARINASAGNYYVWYRFFSSVNSFIPCVLKVNENGNPDAGWVPDGIPAVSGVNNSIFYDAVYASLMGADLVMVMAGNSSYSIHAQKITPEGDFPWGTTGIQVSGPNAHGLSCHSDAARLSLFYIYGQGTERFLRLQALSSDGILLFGDDGLQVNAIPRLEFRNPVLSNCDNGSYIAVWAARMRESTEEIDLLYRKISSLGELIGDNDGILCNRARLQDNPRIGTIGNETLICWMDHRAGFNENNEILSSIYVQKLSGEGSEIIDESSVPFPELPLLTCYPNPFVNMVNLKFKTELEEKVSIIIYNIKGQRIRHLLSSEYLYGCYAIVWDGRDDKGYPVSSGIYFAWISNSRAKQVIKLVRLRAS